MFGKRVVIVSQHYPPDPSTTAVIMAEIALHLASGRQVLVLSGTPGSGCLVPSAGEPTVVEIRNKFPKKGALIRRAALEISFTLRAFWGVLMNVRRGDAVLTVTAPFVLPYAVAVATRLKGACCALILHDLYPDVLVMAGLMEPRSLAAKAIRAANGFMFRMLSAVITIGRDTERLLARYRSLTSDKIVFIPNWATLSTAVRPIEPDNPYRRSLAARFVVGLSGNLGFTHDPLVVFEAARLLRDSPDVHLLLSGWGIGFERLKRLQSEANLPNVTLVDRVGSANLERLLSAADIWIIPYRKNVAGVSVPSRFYNLLAIGRPVILVSEPEAEAALTISENRLGWVTSPGAPDELAKAILTASLSIDTSMAERAVAVAGRFSRERAMCGYANLIDRLLMTVGKVGSIS
jgi:colanic acid biosynthesis glycosyl transferase WcaI